MRFERLLAAACLLAAGAIAQDRVTLTNGDVLTGTIKTMADGKVTVNSPLLGDVTVPLSSVSDMATQAQVDLATVGGDRLKRRILGLEAGKMRLEGDTTSLELDKLSQINPPEAPPPAWTGSLKIGGIYVDGNTERRAMNTAFDATRKTDADRISADATWDYSQDRDTTAGSPTLGEWRLNQRRTAAGLKYDYFLSKRWYALATARVLGDTLADIQLRFTGGAGLGYTVIDTKETSFLTEAGLSYVNENYRTATSPGVDFMALRIAYKLTHQFTDTTRLVHGVEAFPSVEDSDDVYLQKRTEIVTSLTESMLASLSWVMDWDNTPAPGAERADHRVVLSVGWSF